MTYFLIGEPEARHLPILIFQRTDGSKGYVYPNFLYVPDFWYHEANWRCPHLNTLAGAGSPFHARELQPLYPAVGFFLTHKAESPKVCLQKRDFLSPSYKYRLCLRF